MRSPEKPESAHTWTYEADHAVDMQGADVFHHIVSGERHIAEVETEADARFILRAVVVLARVESLVENVERKAAEDRAAVEAGGLTVGEVAGRMRRADNYDLVADGLRRALAVVATPTGDRATDRIECSECCHPRRYHFDGGTCVGADDCPCRRRPEVITSPGESA